MAAELTLYEALVEAGVSKERARDVVLAQAGTMHEFLSQLVTKSELSVSTKQLQGEIGAVRAEIAAVKNELKGEIAEFRAYVDGRFNVVAEQFVQVRQDMNAMSNKIVVRLGALMVVLFGLAASVMRLPH
jgi:uncharacterized protein involved in exopolysaccharide biosynthesis